MSDTKDQLADDAKDRLRAAAFWAAVDAAAPPKDEAHEPSVEQRHSLTMNEDTILRELRRQAPRRVDIADLMTATDIGNYSCKRIVQSLIKRGLAERPTPRGGATITLIGRAVLAAVDAPRGPP
jgi:DNA-binding MarR family transcriptional regulator